MTLSIIIPTLNEEKAIERTLKTLRDGLTDIDHELVVADSGSTDATLRIAERYARVLPYRGEKRTIAWNKNRGAAEARGHYLVFIDADVIVPDPNAFFKTALARFTADPTLVGLTVSLKVLPEMATWTDNLVFGMVNLDHRFNNNVTHTGSASGEFQMIPASVFRKLGGYAEHLAVAEDNEMFMRLAKTGRTRMESSLAVYHTARRAHELGWIPLLWSWFVNYCSMKYFKRSYDREWKQIR